MNHTKGRWTKEENPEFISIYCEPKEQDICTLTLTDNFPRDYDDLTDEEQKANAEHIVKCVNLHEKLVDACKSARDSLGYMNPTDKGEQETRNDEIEDLNEIINEATAG